MRLLRLDLLAHGGEHFGNEAWPLGIDRCFHFHGFGSTRKFLALADGVSSSEIADSDDQAGQGRADSVGVIESAGEDSRTDEASDWSATSTSRGWPLSSKRPCKLSGSGSPTASSLTIKVLLFFDLDEMLDAQVGLEKEDRCR